VVGKALSGTIISVIQAAIILSLFPFLGMRLGLFSIAETLAISVLLSFCLSSFGIVIATFYESFESFSVIMNFIVMPMFFLSGAMYPVKMLPDILKFATRLNPFTYGIDALKHAVFGGPEVVDFTIVTDVTVLCITSVVLVIIAGLMFERKK
jgi:ABC-2 type transport system permease protein